MTTELKNWKHGPIITRTNLTLALPVLQHQEPFVQVFAARESCTFTIRDLEGFPNGERQWCLVIEETDDQIRDMQWKLTVVKENVPVSTSRSRLGIYGDRYTGLHFVYVEPLQLANSTE